MGGHAAAMNHLADLLRYGRGEPANLPAAAGWYLKAPSSAVPAP
jgi:TPR repeat protein